MLAVSDDGYFHPDSNDQVAELIIMATQRGGKVRTRGAAHSVPESIYSGGKAPSTKGFDVDILLDRLARVEFNDVTHRVKVGAGCRLGEDPDDPMRTSTEESLTYQLQKHGWALPITGGIVRQTVGGFVSTGSAGGSTQYSLSEQIVAIELVDGTGKVHLLEEPQPEFYAAGVSMGLLGVITSVTFQCEPSFKIQGTEITHQERLAHVELFSKPPRGQKLLKAGAPPRVSLPSYLEAHDYARCLWWPQRHVEKIAFWQADRFKDPPAEPFPKPYHSFPAILGSMWLAQLLVAIIMRVLSPLNPPAARSLFGRGRNWLLEYLFYGATKLFLVNGLKGGQFFRDFWMDGIPLDNGVDYHLLPTEFSEMWLPFEKTVEIMDELRKHYDGASLSRVGTYAIDIYATPKSKFWLSPGYGQKSIKFDFFWFSKNWGDPAADFFPQFWDLFIPHGCRFHWGKHFPIVPEHLKAVYPMWESFLALRDEMDPDQVFVTDYWSARLGILSAQGVA